MIDFYNLIVHFIRSLCICTWSLFLLLYVLVQFCPWFEFYLPLFSRNRCVTSLKTAAKETSSRENCYKLTSGRSTELKLWSIGGEFNRQTNKFRFSTVYHQFRARFWGEKTRFAQWKAKLKRTLEKRMARHIKANSSAQWDALKIALVSRFSLIFWSY